MDGIENYKSKLRAVEDLVKKMENGVLSIPELSELETLTRELHERSIILKYKAFESKVEKEKPAAESTEVEEVEEVADKIEPVIEEVEEEVKPSTEELDFSMFGQEETIVEPEKPVEVIKEEVKVVEEPVVEEPAIEDTIEEPVIEEPVVEVKQPEEAPKVEKIEESAPLSTGSLLERMKLPDNDVSSQFTGSKIQSLAGAFGLNERLRYIKELFDGSGDSFKAAIEVLDSQSTIGVASEKVEEFAFQNSWDLEEEVVLEFMALIKRRYA